MSARFLQEMVNSTELVGIELMPGVKLGCCVNCELIVWIFSQLGIQFRSMSVCICIFLYLECVSLNNNPEIFFVSMSVEIRGLFLTAVYDTQPAI